MLQVIISAFTVFVLSASGLIVAADQAVPGERLYDLDRAVESARLSLVLSDETRASSQLGFAAERLKEARQLVESGDSQGFTLAMEGFDSAIADAPVLVDQGIQQVRISLDEDDDIDYCNEAGVRPHPVAQGLSARYNLPYEDVIAQHCQGLGFGELAIAYGLAKGDNLEAEGLLAARESGLSWGQIMQDLGLRQQTDGDPEDGDEDSERAGVCEGAMPKEHPAALKLSARFGVGYEEIVGWFCSGFGFGEIAQSYAISQSADGSVAAADLFALKNQGMGWGQIKQLYGFKGRPDKEIPGPPEVHPGGGPGFTPPGQLKDKNK